MKLLTNGILKIDGSLDVDMLTTPEECEEIRVSKSSLETVDGDFSIPKLLETSSI